jgi:hypothetical protein
MLDLLFALLLALLLPGLGCTGAKATDPVTPPPQDSTPTAPDSTVPVPRGIAALDGTFSSGEWSRAYVGQLTSGGDVRLMHDSGYLYLGVQRRADLVVTVCLDLGDSVAVLHSSAAIGTAVYRRAQDTWTLTRRFTWELRDSTMSAAAQQERQLFLQREGWVATNAFVGARTDTEFKIAMPSGRLRLAVVPMSVGSGYQEIAWWPGWLADGCRSEGLLSGYLPGQTQFATRTWIAVVAGP